MTIGQSMEMVSYLFNIIGIITCLVGLTLAQRTSRPLGYSIAVIGFLIAASPLLAQLLGFIEPSATAPLPQ